MFRNFGKEHQKKVQSHSALDYNALAHKEHSRDTSINVIVCMYLCVHMCHKCIYTPRKLLCVRCFGSEGLLAPLRNLPEPAFRAAGVELTPKP